MEKTIKKGRDFKLEGMLCHTQWPYLIVHRTHDVLGVKQVTKVQRAPKESGWT
jgi:hypothetical protein